MKEIVLSENALITSKTDLKGNIIYANNDFLKYAGYKVDELLYKSHNIVRHEDMPRTVFKCLWDYIQKGDEIFAFVKNKSKDGNFYWVFANVSASFDANGDIINYYSVRRAPNRTCLFYTSPSPRGAHESRIPSPECSMLISILDIKIYNRLTLLHQ
ncbi:PAS domain-containing protein, partial [Campylobacter jejuni]